MSNGIIRIKGMFKILRSTFPELSKLSDVIALSSFVARKFKPTSLYVHQKSTTFTVHIKKTYGDRHLSFVQWLLSNLSYCRGQRQLNLISNANFILHLRPYLSGLFALSLYTYFDGDTFIEN